MSTSETHTDPRTPGRKERQMASTLVHCPCCGEPVRLFPFDFDSTTVEIAACSARQEQGMLTITLRKSAGLTLEPVDRPVQHTTGLVTFG